VAASPSLADHHHNNVLPAPDFIIPAGEQARIGETLKAARGQPVEKRLDVGTALVTRENAASFLR